MKQWTEWERASGEHRIAHRVAFLVARILRAPLRWLGEQREHVRRGFDFGLRPPVPNHWRKGDEVRQQTRNDN